MKTEKSFVFAILSLFSVFWSVAFVCAVAYFRDILQIFDGIKEDYLDLCTLLIVLAFDIFSVITCARSKAPRYHTGIALIGTVIYVAVISFLIFVIYRAG